jgi:hypothetical protein
MLNYLVFISYEALSLDIKRTELETVYTFQLRSTVKLREIYTHYFHLPDSCFGVGDTSDFVRY